MAEKTYARIASNAVAELVTLDASLDIAQVFNSALIFIDVTNVSPQPQQGWTYTPPSTFATVAPTLSLAQQAQVAAVGGVSIALSGSVTLAATLFPTDTATQAKLAAVVTTIAATGEFPGGASSYPMKDASGAWHVFTLSQYKTVAGAIAAFVAGNVLIVDGNPLGATELPATSIALTV